jgi:signal transduction histidine kinase
MQINDLINRLAALPNLEGVPRQELEWLVAHGQLEIHEAGTVIAPKGKRVDKLWIIITGRVAVKVDRGVGPRLVIEWHTGEVSGMLPYSRMTGPPGDNYLESRSELLAIQVKHFPEMIHRCPKFTAYTVHLMLDRARSFNASDLQDEKMISLGKLAAGLAHEINNPAAAIVSGANQLLRNLAEVDAASRSLGAAAITDDMFASIEQLRSACLITPADTLLSPIQQADREDEIADWLVHHKVAKTNAELLAYTPITIDMLEKLANKLSDETLAFALHWIATYCATSSIAVDIEQAASRISELVAAIKRFTYMDNLAGSELVEVEAGLRDTIKVLAAKSKSKGATITLDVQANLPRVRATGSELNQVWMNLMDNALDAISDSGNINISAYMEMDRLVVRIADDGHGIPEKVLPMIFDPFFTTKPQGHGTGLGLDITRRLLRMYHGDITIQSTPGRTECRVSLIVEKSNSTEADQPNEDKDKV